MRARQDLGQDVEIALSLSGAPAPPAQRMRSDLQLLERVASADDRRMVVFLDEFQDVAGGRFGAPDIEATSLNRLRSRRWSVSGTRRLRLSFRTPDNRLCADIW